MYSSKALFRMKKVELVAIAQSFNIDFDPDETHRATLISMILDYQTPEPSPMPMARGDSAQTSPASPVSEPEVEGPPASVRVRRIRLANTHGSHYS